MTKTQTITPSQEGTASQTDAPPVSLPPEGQSQRLFYDDTVVLDEQGNPVPDPLPLMFLAPVSPAG